MIPMLVGARFVRRKATARRSKVWLGSQSTTALGLAPSTAAVFTIVDETQVETQGKPTIARVRGTWNVWHDRAAASATSAMSVAAGITVVSTKSLAIGVTALPTPITNIEWPWLWWDSAVVGIDVGDATGFERIERNNRLIDSKAMRKVPPASTIVLIVEAGAALLGAPDARLAFVIRMLLMPS